MSERDTVILLNLYQSALKIRRFSTKHSNWESFAEDEKSYDATMMNFIVIGECVGKLSDNFKVAQPQVDWRKIYNYRNVIAHDYFGIDTEMAWNIIVKNIPILIQTVENEFDANDIHYH